MYIFRFDIVMIIIALFSIISGAYNGIFKQLRKTLSSCFGIVASLLVTNVVYTMLSSYSDIITKVVKIINFVILVEEEECAKLLIALAIFVVVKYVVFFLFGVFKPKGIKSFISDKSKLSGFIGLLFGLINAYVIGCIIYIMFFVIEEDAVTASYSSYIFLPILKLAGLVA